jgi:dTDP-4-amino-4,6-dideoxygalactose transaminase
MGYQVRIFEKKFSKIVNQKYSTMVNSGSSANLVLLQALKNLGIIKANDKRQLAYSNVAALNTNNKDIFLIFMGVLRDIGVI